MRWAYERRPLGLAFAASLLIAACAGGAGSPSRPTEALVTTPPGTTSPGPTPAGNEIAFTDEGVTGQSGHTGPTMVRADRVDAGRWRITAYQGQQSTGGYGIRIEKVTLAGTVLSVHARFAVPSPGSLTTQVLTSPAHTISLVAAFDQVVLYDQTGAARSRTPVRQ